MAYVLLRSGCRRGVGASMQVVRSWLRALVSVDSGDPEYDRRARTLNAIVAVTIPMAVIGALVVLPYPNGPQSAAVLIAALVPLAAVIWLSSHDRSDAAVALFAVALWLVVVGQPVLTGDLSTNMMLVPLGAVMLIYVIPRHRLRWLVAWSATALVVLQVGTNDADTVLQPRFVWNLNAALATVVTIAVLAFAASQLAESVRKEKTLTHELTARDAMVRRLEETANTDPLTGLLNRRSLDHSFSRVPPRSAVALLDLDRFKTVNDRYSHAAGDRLLVEFATVMADAARPDDLLFRLGGDEFLVIREHAGADELGAWLHGLRAQVRRRGFDVPKDVTVTFSGGVVAVGDLALEVALDRVDRAMYAAKEAGRDSIVVID